MDLNIRTGRLLICLGIVSAAVLLFAGSASAQEEVASSLRRYKDREASTGIYEEYEVMPRSLQPLIAIPRGLNRTIPYSQTAARVRIRTRLADSHQGIKFYDVLRCDYCHKEETKDIHTVRGNLTCRQCHGGEPIASIEHTYSPMNPIRRHSYVCAKCHEGASPSFATYVVHQPAAGSLTARTEFPILYYSYWFMLALLVGTLAFFLPHTFLFGFREVLTWLKTRRIRDEGDIETEPDIAPKPDIETGPEDAITRIEPDVDSPDIRKDVEKDDERHD